MSLPAHGAIVFGQVDTFQDGTTMSWMEGVASPNPPANVSTGGPAGPGDAYLENISSGGFGAGSRMLMFNLNQWIGNYTGAGVNRIALQMANYGPGTLFMRVAFQSAAGTTYCSSSATMLPADGVWRSVNFDLTTSAMTSVSGAEPLADALSHVSEVRLLSSVGGPAFTGDPVAATLGVDNITATSISVPAVITAAVSRKNHNGTDFDVALPLTGTPGVECRLGGATNDYSMVVTFSANVSVTGTPQAEVIAGAGAIGSGGVSNGGAVSVSGNVVTIPLTGVTSQQAIQMRLHSANGSDFIIPMDVLIGDPTADRSVNSADVTLTRSRSGLATDANNFRTDYNEDGSINAADVTLVRARSGDFIPQ